MGVPANAAHTAQPATAYPTNGNGAAPQAAAGAPAGAPMAPNLDGLPPAIAASIAKLAGLHVKSPLPVADAPPLATLTKKGNG